MPKRPAVPAQVANEPAAKPRRRSSAEVRALILDAAREVFSERGYSGATTREIAERAGVVEPLLFRHFGSKTNLFMEAVLVQSGEFFDDVAREAEGRRRREVAAEPAPVPDGHSPKTRPPAARTGETTRISEGRSRRGTDEVRSLILDAAREVFSERGFSNATTREVAERAGVVEVLIFRHFQSKQNLFLEAVMDPLGQTLGHFIEGLSQRLADGDPKVMLREIVGSFYDVALGERRLLTGLLSASEFESDTLGDRLVERMSQNIDQMLPLTEQHLHAFGLRQADSDVLDRAVLAMILALAVFDPWIMPAGSTRPTRDRIVDEITSILRYGLVPPDQVEAGKGR